MDLFLGHGHEFNPSAELRESNRQPFSIPPVQIFVFITVLIKTFSEKVKVKTSFASLKLHQATEINAANIVHITLRGTNQRKWTSNQRIPCHQSVSGVPQ